MILYLDTSAFVRLYIGEIGHQELLVVASRATVVASHAIAYAEMRAALARMRWMQRLSKDEYGAALKAYETDWRSTLQVLPTEPVIRRAGTLAEQFGLRGYDSVHLAAAESLLVAPVAAPVTFAAFNSALNLAAQALGLGLLSL